MFRRQQLGHNIQPLNRLVDDDNFAGHHADPLLQKGAGDLLAQLQAAGAGAVEKRVHAAALHHAEEHLFDLFQGDQLLWQNMPAKRDVFL